jgi:hypothetical protein
MADNVVTLRGGRRLENGEPNESCVRELERLLDAARSGEITGVAGAYKHQNGIVSFSFAGAIGGFAMIGGLEGLKHELLERSLGGK